MYKRQADGGIFDSIVTIEGIKRLIPEHLAISGGLGSLVPVSYTHLDVYKRQNIDWVDRYCQPHIADLVRPNQIISSHLLDVFLEHFTDAVSYTHLGLYRS